MNISGLSLDQFRVVVEDTSRRYGGNLAVHADASDHSARKPRCTARVTVRDSYGPGARTSWSGRHGRYACWHAYRDVLLSLFRRYPDAIVRTGLAVYRGQEGFLRDYPATGHVNIGSQVQPVTMPALCACEDTRPVCSTVDRFPVTDALYEEGHDRPGITPLTVYGVLHRIDEDLDWWEHSDTAARNSRFVP